MLARFARGAVLLLAALASPSYADSCIWYSHDDSIRQVQTGTNQVTRVVPLRHPHRLAMNAEDCGVWTLDKQDRRILRFGAEGALEKEIRVRELHPHLDEVERLQLDPYDGSLWVSDERRLFHISAEGALLGAFGAPGEIRRLRVALDRTLWVLGKRELWRFDAKGVLLASYPLGRHLGDDARYFALDNLGGFIWLADEHELARLNLSNPAEPPLRLRLRDHIRGFALDPFSGNVWVAQKEALLAFSRAGAAIHSVDLEALGIRKPEKLAFDPVSRSLWAGAEKSLSRFTDSGQLVVKLLARDGDEALGVPAFKVLPTLTLVRPPQDALTNNPTPEFRLSYGAECNGVPCGFPGSYLGAYQLSATLNNQSVGAAFQFDPGAGESSFTPSSRLPEGPNSFSAQVKDGFGHSSNTVSNSFTVDTIAPTFLAITPADGSVLQTPQALIQGSVDDPGATVVLDSLGLTQAAPSFSFPVTLQPGANNFVLSAIDRAGNRTSTQRTLIFNPLSITISSPGNGAALSGSSVMVTGTMQGPANTGVTVNGVVAALVGDRFYASVPLQTGANTLTAIAKTPEGLIAQQSISVTSSGPAPIEVAATPQSGLAPLKVNFTVNAANGTAIQRIEADFDGDGSTDFASADPNAPMEFAYNQPGVFPASLVVTDGQGNATTHTLQIIVQDANLLDQQFRAMWSGFTASLAARDVPKALQPLSAAAQGTYGPVFAALAPNLPQIVASFGPPQLASLSSQLGEYALGRTVNGVRQLFFLYFVRDTDGIWRIDSM